MTNVLRQMGIEGIFLTEAFNRGVNEYFEGNKKASDVTKQTTSAINAAGEGLGGPLSAALGMASGGFTALATVALGGIGAVTAAIGGLIAVTGTLAMNTAKVENIEMAYNNLAGTVNLSMEAMRKSVDGLITDDALMTIANEALLGSGQELGKEFGEHLPGLLEIARASSKATGKDFESMMSAIDMSIKTGMTRGLRMAGILVDQADAQKKYADSIGVTVEALTDEQKSIALLNAVLEKGQPMVDLWAGATETASDSMKRAKTSFDNTADALGTFFLPALKTVWDAIGRVAKGLEIATTEGGALYPILVNLGAAMSLLADGFSNGIDLVMDLVNGLFSDMAGLFDDTATNAFDWGINIIMQFAQGIINGATAAINTAAGYVNSILSGWFAPGSPPRVAPQIDQWGKATMGAYLEGFTEADFGILKSLEGPLRTAMSMLAKKGENIGPAWSNVSKAISEALLGGDLTQAFDDIGTATGQYANDIILLAKAEWDLKKSTDAVTEAELRLKNAQKSQSDTNAKLNKQLADYNRALRAGASKDVLARKLAEINATQKAADASVLEVDAAKQSLDSAKEQNDVMKEQLALQKQVLDQVLSLAKAQQELATPAVGKGGGGGGGGGGLNVPGGPTGREMTGYGATPQELINQAIEDAKASMKTKLGELWETIKAEIGEQLGPSFEGFKTALGGLLDKNNQVWDKIMAKVTDAKDYVSGEIEWAKTTWSTWWDEHGKSVEIIWEKIKKVFEDVTKWITDNIVTPWLDAFKANWTTSWDNIGAGLSAAWDLMKIKIEDALDIFGNLVDTWAAAATTDWGKVFNNIGDTIVRSFEKGIADAWGWLMEQVDKLVAQLPESVRKALGMGSPSKPFMAIGANIDTSLAKGMQDNLSSVRGAATNVATTAFAPAMALSPVNTSNITNSSTLNMGGVNVNNQMDLNILMAMVQRSMIKGLSS